MQCDTSSGSGTDVTDDISEDNDAAMIGRLDGGGEQKLFTMAV